MDGINVNEAVVDGGSIYSGIGDQKKKQQKIDFPAVVAVNRKSLQASPKVCFITQFTFININ